MKSSIRHKQGCCDGRILGASLLCMSMHVSGSSQLTDMLPMTLSQDCNKQSRHCDLTSGLLQAIKTLYMNIRYSDSDSLDCTGMLASDTHAVITHVCANHGTAKSLGTLYYKPMLCIYHRACVCKLTVLCRTMCFGTSSHCAWTTASKEDQQAFYPSCTLQQCAALCI